MAASSFGAGNKDFWLVRTDESGDNLWSRTYGGQGEDYCYSMVQTADGGFALAGWTSPTPGGQDFWLVRTDENGDSLWSRTYDRNGSDGCISLIETSDGGFVLAGFTSKFGHESSDFLLVRTNENGDSLWSRTYGGEKSDICCSLIQTADGGYALAGSTTSFGMGYKDFWLLRTDEHGDSLWSHTYGGGSYDGCKSLIQTNDRGFVLAGYTHSFGKGEEFWLVRTNEVGDSLWSRTYGGEDNERCSSLIQTADGGFALTGGTSSFGAGCADFWIVKLSPENSPRR